MRRITPRAAPILLVSVLAPLYSQQVTTWQDPSPNAVQFVTVENDVRLEVLDWGGAGRPRPWALHRRSGVDPDRVAGLVYLDAGYPYAFHSGKGQG